MTPRECGLVIPAAKAPPGMPEDMPRKTAPPKALARLGTYHYHGRVEGPRGQSRLRDERAFGTKFCSGAPWVVWPADSWWLRQKGEDSYRTPGPWRPRIFTESRDYPTNLREPKMRIGRLVVILSRSRERLVCARIYR